MMPTRAWSKLVSAMRQWLAPFQGELYNFRALCAGAGYLPSNAVYSFIYFVPISAEQSAFPTCVCMFVPFLHKMLEWARLVLRLTTNLHIS